MEGKRHPNPRKADKVSFAGKGRVGKVKTSSIIPEIGNRAGRKVFSKKCKTAVREEPSFLPFYKAFWRKRQQRDNTYIQITGQKPSKSQIHGWSNHHNLIQSTTTTHPAPCKVTVKCGGRAMSMEYKWWQEGDGLN